MQIQVFITQLKHPCYASHILFLFSHNIANKHYFTIDNVKHDI
jgi:hypothetical protein